MILKKVAAISQRVKKEGGVRNFTLASIAKILMSGRREDGSIDTDIFGAYRDRDGDGINPHLSKSKIISNLENYVLRLMFLGLAADFTNIITINASEQQKLTIYGLLAVRVTLIIASSRNILSDGAVALIYKYLKDSGSFIKDNRAKLPDIFPNADSVVPTLVEMVIKLQTDNDELRNKVDQLLKDVQLKKRVKRKKK